jgi:glutaconate CoA-transferase subunit B
MVEDGDSVVSVPEIFNYWLQTGRVDVGFLGGAQIDRYSTINTTVMGPYDEPRVCAYPAPGERPRSPLRPKR